MSVPDMINLDDPDWNKGGGSGLLPAIIQDADTHDVLMLGYMSRDALAASYDSGKVTFYSRSKQRLWMKGESSGNMLTLVDVKPPPAKKKKKSPRVITRILWGPGGVG